MKKLSVQTGPNMASAEKTGSLWKRNAGEAARDVVSLAVEINELLLINQVILFCRLLSHCSVNSRSISACSFSVRICHRTDGIVLF